METTPLPALLFDFDGTIADSFDQAFSAANRIAEESGMPGARAGDKEALHSMTIRQILRTFHVPLLRIPRMLVKMRSELLMIIDAIRPVPGICDVLQELRKRQLRLGIVTANSRIAVGRFLIHHGIDVFEFGSYSAGLWSKAGKIRRLMHQEHLDRHGVYYIGDTQEDVAAGHRAGVHTIAVSWGYASRERLAAAQPEQLVDEPRQLLRIGDTRVASDAD